MPTYLFTTFSLFYLFSLILTGSIAGYFIYKLRFAYKHFRMRRRLSAPSLLNDLPSVSVCIPARNETHAMTKCLEHVIASTYPKLEIIVLDDSSADNTSYLIKSFAHDGVRFVEGSTLSSGWLGKNHALQGLLDEASGTYIFFMDVDTIIAPDTIEQLVAYIKQENASMISVLPQRSDGIRASVLFSPLRYFWELVFHRRRNPAVASSAWMIDRHVLRDDLGSFLPIAQAIQPEAVLASRLMEKNKYRFMLSTTDLGVTYEKKWRSQVDTSVRLLFPLLHKKFSYVVTSCMYIVFLCIPLVVLAMTPETGWTILQYIASIELLLFMAIYGSYLRKVWTKGWVLGLILWPIILVQEMILIIASALRYTTNNVSWKGRPVVASDTTRIAK